MLGWGPKRRLEVDHGSRPRPCQRRTLGVPLVQGTYWYIFVNGTIGTYWWWMFGFTFVSSSSLSASDSGGSSGAGYFLPRGVFYSTPIWQCMLDFIFMSSSSASDSEGSFGARCPIFFFLQAYLYGTLPDSVTNEEKQKAQIDRMIALRYISCINLISISLFQLRAHSDTHIDILPDDVWSRRIVLVSFSWFWLYFIGFHLLIIIKAYRD